ncbi:hypothetical protein FB446DRAFT_709727 [Lentinula raphanica]|nr:hypothetical protein FB446DRAFT_709727 [Lentinula raphanica]
MTLTRRDRDEHEGGVLGLVSSFKNDQMRWEGGNEGDTLELRDFVRGRVLLDVWRSGRAWGSQNTSTRVDDDPIGMAAPRPVALRNKVVVEEMKSEAEEEAWEKVKCGASALRCRDAE